MSEIGPVTLEGRWVRLEPLQPHHEPALLAISREEEIRRHLAATLDTPEDVHRWMEYAATTAARGVEAPFATVERATGAVVGTTRFMDIQPAHRTAEIGGTWLDRSKWRTVLNSEAKYLMLQYLFDEVGFRRAWFKTDRLNERSQRAIERLGAVREGVLRKHMIVHGGRSRDSVVYSIVDDEWPAIRGKMEQNLYGD